MQVYVIKNLENDIQFYKWKHIPDVIKIRIVIFASQVADWGDTSRTVKLAQIKDY